MVQDPKYVKNQNIFVLPLNSIQFNKRKDDSVER